MKSFWELEMDVNIEGTTIQPIILISSQQFAQSKKCTSVFEVNADENDGEYEEEDEGGDDKHDYLPPEDGARCPASSTNSPTFSSCTNALQCNAKCSNTVH